MTRIQELGSGGLEVEFLLHRSSLELSVVAIEIERR